MKKVLQHMVKSTRYRGGSQSRVSSPKVQQARLPLNTLQVQKSSSSTTSSQIASYALALMFSLEFFLSFHGSFLNIHYVLHTPFLSLSSLSGNCAFTHFHGALFCC